MLGLIGLSTEASRHWNFRVFCKEVQYRVFCGPTAQNKDAQVIQGLANSGSLQPLPLKWCML